MIVGKIAGVLSSMFFLLFRPISRALEIVCSSCQSFKLSMRLSVAPAYPFAV